ncbi:Ribonuclease HI [Methylophaga frappieri]|uniref:Ribonuclease H n=2 Tax=Methylophaga frappieri (strain ATCC BAA-2434 / DSM 25690 / JAM7) TaxID=754477 RepID=I1YK32_METFJ|nr:Ribonuclease HI [Methylophaga frappieri]
MYTDGACSGNPGPGGWGVILRAGKTEKMLSGAEADTTNNRMEMMAVIAGLQALKQPCHVTITTDSQYVMKGMTEWLPGWLARNWRTAAKQPVKNADLWQQLVTLSKPHQIDWQWVRGHSGHPDNERADQLAVQARESLS